MKSLSALAAAVLPCLAACSMFSGPGSIWSQPFGVQRDGVPATLFVLQRGPLEAHLCDRGATLVALRCPDRLGQVADVILGFDDVGGYEANADQYLGSTIGRVCNRIGGARFMLDGFDFVLAPNDGRNHLHGGSTRSFDKVRWHGEATRVDGAPAVVFRYTSPDGEEGYPGNLVVAVTYSMPADGELRIDYEAVTDRRTPVSLTNHAYWNLAGHGASTVLDHELQVDAERFTPTDGELIPTGAFAATAGTPLDFRRPTAIGARIDRLVGTPARGYDHNFVLGATEGLRRAAVLHHPPSGRLLEVDTTAPAMQVYSGNALRGQQGKGGAVYAPRSGLCLEPQHHPNAINEPRFPPAVLAPGQVFRATTLLRLSTR